MYRNAILATIVATTALTNVQAQEDNFLGFNGQADVNAIISSGNTDKSTVGAAVKGTREWGVWSLDANAAANRGESNGDRDAEEYNFGLQGNRQIIDDKTYAFAGATYEVDNFSGFDYVATQTVGLGRQFIENNVYTLKGQFGIGAQEFETDAGDKTEEFVARPELNFGWNITDALQFTQDLGAVIGSDLTTIKSRSAIRNQLAGNLFLQAAYEVENRSDVPAGNDDTDTKTTLGLSYGF